MAMDFGIPSMHAQKRRMVQPATVRFEKQDTATHHCFFFELPGVQEGHVNIRLLRPDAFSRQPRLHVQAVRFERRINRFTGDICSVRVPMEGTVCVPASANIQTLEAHFEPGNAPQYFPYFDGMHRGAAQIGNGLLSVRFDKVRSPPSTHRPTTAPIAPSCSSVNPSEETVSPTSPAIASVLSEPEAEDNDGGENTAPLSRPSSPIIAAQSPPQDPAKGDNAVNEVEQSRAVAEHCEEADRKFNAVKIEVEKVLAQWKNAAFRTCPGEVPKDVDKARKHYEELLLRQLIGLDSVQTFGLDTIRQQRKAVVKVVQHHIDALEAHVRAEKDSA